MAACKTTVVNDYFLLLMEWTHPWSIRIAQSAPVSSGRRASLEGIQGTQSTAVMLLSQRFRWRSILGTDCRQLPYTAREPREQCEKCHSRKAYIWRETELAAKLNPLLWGPYSINHPLLHTLWLLEESTPKAEHNVFSLYHCLSPPLYYLSWLYCCNSSQLSPNFFSPPESPEW